eukprot:4453455-Amphidinium_carterae.1
MGQHSSITICAESKCVAIITRLGLLTCEQQHMGIHQLHFGAFSTSHHQCETCLLRSQHFQQQRQQPPHQSSN